MSSSKRLKLVEDQEDEDDNDEDLGDMNLETETEIKIEDCYVSDFTSIPEDLYSTNEFNIWKRPRIIDFDSNTMPVIFQQIDIDHYVITGSNPEPVFRIFGINESGNSILALIHGFYPYFYVKSPENFKIGDCETFRDFLNELLKSKTKRHKEIGNLIINVELFLKANIYGYSQDKKFNFIKITLLLPSLLSTCKRLLEEGLIIPNCGFHNLSAFDTNIDFTLRFMVDSGFVGCSWIELPANSYQIRCEESKMSLCQLEVDVNWKLITYHPPNKYWSHIVPIRIISFDVMCFSTKGYSPNPETDPVIQISNTVMRFGEQEPFIQCIFTLNSCVPLVGAKVFQHDTEEDLLKHWSQFIREIDPDLISGYNTQTLDLPYLINRAKKLNIIHFNLLGRIKFAQSLIGISSLQSKQFGRKSYKIVHMAGRVDFDLKQIISRDYKLRSYSLHAVAFHFFEEQKQKFSHQVITDLQNGTEFTRHRLAVYSVKTSFLSLRLINKLMLVINYVEMARVAGVPLSYLLLRGQSIKVLSLILRKAKENDFVLPDYKANSSEQYSGGLIIEPERGYYTKPIAVLDFASLYPSIMIAHNLCYTTLLRDKNIIKQFGLSESDYSKTPIESYFVKSSVKKGLLPVILLELLDARKKTKQEMACESDLFMKQVLDGRQLAIKLTANSIYGFTGAQIGRLPCLDISSSTTAYGREMITLTKEIVENELCKTHENFRDTKVIYGDTDSVMCLLNVETVSEAINLGKKAAEIISTKFISPIKMEFENVYLPYLIVNKKRYAGICYTKPDVYDKMNCKGIETVRRDSCPLVGNLLNSCLKRLLIDRDKESALQHAQSVIADLMCNKIDISQLIISRELNKTNKEYTSKQPHSELALKMFKRDPRSAPQLGDRVSYVITTHGIQNKAYTKAEDPLYVLENDLIIDTNYYLKNQLINPLLRIFEPIFGKDVTSRRLLYGEHMLTKSKPQSNTGPLFKYTVIKPKCVSCKNILQNNEKSLCLHCRDNASTIYLREITCLRSLEKKFCRLWTECQRCTENLHKEVLCSNHDCPIFFKRKAIQKSLIMQNETIEKFERDLECLGCRYYFACKAFRKNLYLQRMRSKT